MTPCLTRDPPVRTSLSGIPKRQSEALPHIVRVAPKYTMASPLLGGYDLVKALECPDSILGISGLRELFGDL
jgi:hypothetical protein